MPTRILPRDMLARRVRSPVLSLLLAVLVAVVGAACSIDLRPQPAPTPDAVEKEISSLARELERERAEATATAQAQPTQPPQPSPAPTSPASAPAASAVSPAHAAEVQRIKDEVVQIRGLRPLEPVATEFLTRDEVSEVLLELFDRDYLPEERERDQRLLVALGLLEEHRSIVQEWLVLYEEQVVGLYDDDTRKLYVVVDGPDLAPSDRVTFAHEYVHALQDQHFNLSELTPKHSDNRDASRAAHALIEGDAVLSMALYANRALTQQEQAQLGQEGGGSRLYEAPLIVRTELLFPYTEGFRFVTRLFSQGGFAAVDRAFRDPPQSTQQILNPEKYDQRKSPVEVFLPDPGTLPLVGWQHLTSNTMGELHLRVLIEQYSDPPTAQQAAVGWGGDRWHLLTRGDETLLVLRTVWDTEQDAQDFLVVYGQGLGARFSNQGRVERSLEWARATAPGYWVSADRRGDLVDIVIAPDAETGQAGREWLAANR